MRFLLHLLAIATSIFLSYSALGTEKNLKHVLDEHLLHMNVTSDGKVSAQSENWMIDEQKSDKAKGRTVFKPRGDDNRGKEVLITKNGNKFRTIVSSGASKTTITQFDDNGLFSSSSVCSKASCRTITAKLCREMHGKFGSYDTAKLKGEECRLLNSQLDKIWADGDVRPTTRENIKGINTSGLKVPPEFEKEKITAFNENLPPWQANIYLVGTIADICKSYDEQGLLGNKSSAALNGDPNGTAGAEVDADPSAQREAKRRK